MPAGGGDLTFWTSYDTEEHWDFLAVEAQDGRRQRLDDAAGRERAHERRTRARAARRAGSSCTRSSSTTRRSTRARRRRARRTGTSGAWNAASGNSQRLAGVVDRPRRVRRQDGRDLDRLHQRLGHAEPRRVPGRHRVAGRLDLVRGDRHRWLADARPPPGSGANANNWAVTDAGGFPVGASITTPKSILMGYGFEGMSTRTSARRSWAASRPTSCGERSGCSRRPLRRPPAPATALTSGTRPSLCRRPTSWRPPA